jgi:hypothetical protein
MRRPRQWGAWVFVALVLLVAGERRLADAHFNLRSTALVFENDEALDADEIKVRLIGHADTALPTAPVAVSHVVEVVRSPAPAWRSLPLVDDCASRAPPAFPRA